MIQKALDKSTVIISYNHERGLLSVSPCQKRSWREKKKHCSLCSEETDTCCHVFTTTGSIISLKPPQALTRYGKGASSRVSKFDLVAFIIIKIERGEWKTDYFRDHMEGKVTSAQHSGSMFTVSISAALFADLSPQLNNDSISQSSTQYNQACTCYSRAISSSWVNWHFCPTVTRGEMKTDEEAARRRKCVCVKRWRGQLRREWWVGVLERGCSSRTASNYIRGVKPSITPRLACLSSCHGGKRHCAGSGCRRTRHFAGNTFPCQTKVRARGRKSSIKACF